MTWNVWWRFGGDYHDRWPGIRTVVTEVRPDVLGLVETWSGGGTTQPAELAAALSTAGAAYDSAFTPTALPPEPDQPEHPEQVGMRIGLGLVSRWPIRATEVHELPHAHRGGGPVTALLATLGHPAGPLHVIVTCLEWRPEHGADHRDQAAAVAALATDPQLDGPLPVLVLGDFNVAADQAPIAPLLDALADTYALGGGDPAATTLDSALPMAPLAEGHLLDRRIDHILARAGRASGDLTVTSAFIAGDRPVGGRFPSDHYAVVTDLGLPSVSTEGNAG